MDCRIIHNPKTQMWTVWDSAGDYIAQFDTFDKVIVYVKGLGL